MIWATRRRSNDLTTVLLSFQSFKLQCNQVPFRIRIFKPLRLNRFVETDTHLHRHIDTQIQIHQYMYKTITVTYSTNHDIRNHYLITFTNSVFLVLTKCAFLISKNTITQIISSYQQGLPPLRRSYRRKSQHSILSEEIKWI